MANFFDQADADAEKEKTPSVNFFDQADEPAKKKATGPKGKDTTQLPDDDETGNFMRGIYNYLPQLQETYGGAKVFAGMGLKKLGAADTGQDLIESGKESMDIGESKQLTRESDSLTRAWEKGIGTVVTDWLPYNIGSGVASVGETLAVMGIGAGVGAIAGGGVGAIPGAIGGVISKTLVKKGIVEAAENIIEAEAKKALAAGATKQAAKVAGEVAGAKFIESQSKNVLIAASEMAAKAYGKAGAKAYGATAAMAAQAGLYGTGETTSRAVNEAEKVGMDVDDIDYGRLATAAAVHSVADFFINKIGVNALKIGEKATQSLILDIGKRIAVTGLKEIPAEEIQTMAERYGANLSLTDAEALREYVDTAGAAFGMSVAPGAVGGAKTHYVNKLRKAGAEAETTGKTYKGDLTVNKDVIPPTAKGFSKEDADLLMPATDAAGKPIVADVTAPEVTETTPAPPAPKKPKTTGVALKTIDDATGYVQALDDGTKKPNTMQVNSLMKNLGITPPQSGEGYLGRSVAAIKEHLAQQGAPDVTGIDTQAGGGGPEVAALTDQNQATAGAAGSQSRGVVSTGTNVGTNLDGAKQQPFALNAGAQSVIISNLDQGATVDQVRSLFPATGELANEVFTFAATYNLASEKLKAGSSPEEVIAVFDSGPATLAAINKFSPQGTTSGTTTSQAKQTAPQGQTKPAAGSVSLGDISPELQDQVLTRQNDIYDMESEGANQAKIAAAYKGLNILEESLGLEITKPSTLSAKKDSRFVDVRKDILGQGKQATATEQNLTPAYEGQDLQGAIKLGEKYENKTEAERERAYKESLGEGEAVYRAEQDIKQTEAEKEAGITLKSGAVSQENRDNYDKVREEFPNLPEWRKLDSVDKDVYFENIRYGNMQEHRQAAQALITYLKETGGRDKGYGQGTTNAGDQRAIKNYEDNRAASSKLFNVQFPRWGDLSETAKDIFLGELGKGTGRTMNLAGAQQDVAFAKVGEALKIEQSDASSVQKQRELDNIKKRQEEVQKEAEKNKAELDKLRSDFNRLVASGVPGTYLPSNIIQMVRGNDLPGVLQYLRDKYETHSAKDKIFKAVAQALFQMKLNTKIRYADSLSNGDLAQYDPVSDTIFVTAQGMTASTVLHEIVHAATAKIVNLYTTGQFKLLTEAQIRAVEHLNDLMYETAGRLATRHPEAYEVVGKDSEGNPRYSLMEFLAYALTKDTMQIDLATLQPKKSTAIERLLLPKGSVVTNLPESKSMWSEFGRTIAEIIGLSKVYFRKNKVREDAPYNYLLEIASSFNEIIAKPTEPIFLSPLSTKNKAGAITPATPAVPAQAPKFQTSGLYEKDKSYNLSNKEKHGLDVEGDLSKLGKVKRAFSRHGWRDFVTKAQSRRHHIRAYENELGMAGLLIRDPTLAFNNVSEKQDLALNQGVRYAIDYLQQPFQDLHGTFNNWLMTTNQNTEAGLTQFHKLGEMFGATEKRFTKWLMSVPLSRTQNLIHNGKPISAAERRIALVGDPRTGVDGLVHKVKLNAQQMAAINKELEYLATNHNDPFGDSPRISEKMRLRFADPKSKHKGLDVDMDKPIFNALGIEKATVDKRMAEFLAKSPEEQALIKQIFAQIKIITDATAKLNEIGNYWSMPVSNIVGIYNYQYYMPFKGLSKHSKADDMIDPNSKMNGAELQDEIHAAEGRFATSDNPLLQTIYDGYRAASRAGRKNFTQSIENAVEPTTSKDAYNPTGTGVLPGRVVKTVQFWQRDMVDLSPYKGANSKYMFNYKADGSMNIIAIDNPKLLHAIRYPFQEKSPLWDAANRITGFFGSMHTRFNYNFAPKDFVVNTLTNAWVGATSEKVGPLGAAAYLKDVAMAVVKNGLGKAMNIAVLHEIGSAGSKKVMDDMAAKDLFVHDMLEMIRYGGKSVYMESFSLKSNLENLSQNSFGKNNIITDPISATKLLDSWNNMFEFTSRTAMYSLYKERALKQNIADGMSNKKGPNGELSPAERAAAEESAAFTLNLANFSQQGEWGKIMGGLYMFSKPSSTGAVRAFEAVLPAFTTVKRAMQDLPPVIENNSIAKAKYQETFEKRQFNARVMTTTLIASGMGLFALSMMGAPDDEWERNATRTDNMEQWTRYARFHIPNEVSERIGLGKDIVFQIPWGFGPGAFASAGAQFASMLAGTITPLEAFSNIAFTIMTDAFLPLPISKIPITDAKTSVLWAVDSTMPTVIRPVIEWIANVNGIGQAINSAAQRRMGDAYTGGDRIPEIYKDVADGLYESTEGYIDWSPNTMYFFTNSYLDGVAKIAELMYSWTNLGKGEKEFNAKTDLPLFGSFFGAKTNVDSREYGKIEQKIKEIDSRLYTLEKRNPVIYAEFVAKNPLYPSIVEQYQSAQGELNERRQRATEIRTNKYLAIKDRDALLKLIILEQNMLKHRLVEDFKAMGLER